MQLKYEGTVKASRVVAHVDLTTTQADVRTEYDLQNAGGRIVRPRLGAVRPAIGGMRLREPRAARAEVTSVPARNLRRLEYKVVTTALKPREKRTLQLNHASPVMGTKLKSFLYVPELEIDGKSLIQKVRDYEVSITLPRNARRLVTSSIPPASARKRRDGIVCVFKQSNVYPLPISVKWTEHDVDVKVHKTVKPLPGNRARVTIRVRNRTGARIQRLVVEDSYPAGDATAVSGAPMASAANFRTVYSRTDRDPHLVYRTAFALGARATKVLTYEIRAIGNEFTVPRTKILYSGSLVALSPQSFSLAFPAPRPMPKAAFALPAGWSFDYKHGGDHHLNEHGMWCVGQQHDVIHDRLAWSTGCIYADRNFDDDYKWSVAHQIQRFDPGFARNDDTPWLAKTGSVSAHGGSFQHPSLKHFSNAIVLLRGWRFDFTSKDRHINKMAIRIATTGFNRSLGRITWQTSVTYADRNFDDDYGYRYWYTVLGFNGMSLARSFSGVDHGGTAAHMGSYSHWSLKNYANGMIIPTGWRFDFTSKDHCINEHNFSIRNAAYSPANGKLTWLANLNYSDKNFDDDYKWRYDVALITTNDGESRRYVKGPYHDNGGLDSESFNVDLKSLFKAITWTNGVKDGDETGIDCGGSSPATNFVPCRSSVQPGNGSSSKYFSLKGNDLRVIKTFATVALLEYALAQGQDFDTFYADSAPEKPDRYVEAIAWYVDQHMDWVKDGGSWKGAQKAIRTLTESGHRGGLDFDGDCEDFAILRAALLRSLGFYHKAIFCADHHNSVDQGQKQETNGGKKKSGGHTYNVVIYRGKYRIMDYGQMKPRYWANKMARDQHVTDNIWNDHTGKYWSKDTSPYGSQPLVNYPGNPSSPSPNWDWRTYFNDITP